MKMKTYLKFKVTAMLAVTVALPLSSYGASFVLDFGATTQNTFNQASDLQMAFTDVADFGTSGVNINATLTADAAWSASGPNTPPRHGSVSGDIIVNADSPESIGLTLSLWDATSGSGFDTLYNPGSSYDWTLAFYDIDSNNPVTNPPNGSNWDIVTLQTPGTYTVSATTVLGIDTSVPGEVTFSGAGAGNVPGQGGITPPLTQEQQDVMVLFNVVDTSSVQFVYTVGEAVTGSYRNLLIDGGSLSTAIDDPVDGVVPEPGRITLLALGGLGVILRRRRTAGNCC